jgi:hypothetical protein
MLTLTFEKAFICFQQETNIAYRNKYKQQEQTNKHFL